MDRSNIWIRNELTTEPSQTKHNIMTTEFRVYAHSAMICTWNYLVVSLHSTQIHFSFKKMNGTHFAMNENTQEKKK